MKVTILKKPDTIKYELSTINYGKTEFQIEINEIKIYDENGTSHSLNANKPLTLSNENSLVFGSVDLTCLGYNDCYKYEFELSEGFVIEDGSPKFGFYFKAELCKPTHIGIDLNSSVIMTKKDAYDDLVEGLTEETDTIIKEIVKKLNEVIGVEY